MSGSTSGRVVVAPSETRARSRPVTASSAPIVHPLAVRPTSFAAPRMVVFAGESTNGPLTASSGARPMRRL